MKKHYKLWFRIGEERLLLFKQQPLNLKHKQNKCKYIYD